VAVDVLEITVLVAFWAFTIWRFSTPQTARGKAVRLVVLLATLSFTFNRREISYATDTVLHVPDISVPLKNLATVAASAGMVHIVGLLSTDPARWAWLRRTAYALLAVTSVAMCVLFLLAPRRPERYDFVYEQAGTPLVTAYASLTQLGLTVGLICALVLFRPAGRGTAPWRLRIGMWLLSAGAVVGLLFMANRVVYQISHAAGSRALDGTGAQTVSRLLLAMMLLLFGVGAALPAMGGLRRWASRYVALQRLRPLWRDLSRAAPGVVLGDPPGRLGELIDPRSVELRLYRRVIEIRDAQWLLTGQAGDDATALWDAVTTGGPRAAPAQASGPPGASQSAGGPDVDAEVRALLGLAHRYRAAAAQSAVATPVTYAGHSDPSSPVR
jgi:hypothetical protein